MRNILQTIAADCRGAHRDRGNLAGAIGAGLLRGQRQHRAARRPQGGAAMTAPERIARALATPGGHLWIGRGGYTLHHDHSRLSGYDCEAMKALAIEAGLPVVDSRKVPFDIAARLAIEGPMVAVNRPPHPGPYHAFSEAPLSLVATAYRQAGAEVHHIADDSGGEGVVHVPTADAARAADRELAQACPAVPGSRRILSGSDVMIRRFLDVSGGHLSAATWEWLDRQLAERFVAGAGQQHGSAAGGRQDPLRLACLLPGRGRGGVTAGSPHGSRASATKRGRIRAVRLRRDPPGGPPDPSPRLHR